MTHHCEKCEAFILDYLCLPLPVIHSFRNLINENGKKRFNPILCKSLQRLFATLCPYDAKDLWNAAIFEASAFSRRKRILDINILSVSLCSFLQIRHDEWINEFTYLVDIAISEGLIRKKGLSYKKMEEMVRFYLYYMFYRMWQLVPNVHYCHNFPDNKTIPELFVFTTRLEGVYTYNKN
jgi:hypothetical protein